jgi:hypothetical protein
MSNDLTTVNDGWEDAANEASENIVRGTLLKFADWRWTAGKESRVMPEGTRLLALATAAAWVRWEDGKPSEYRVRETGKRMPDREELTDTDEERWPRGPDGEPRDPWQNTRFAYLVDPTTAEAYTFSTSSWGGRQAVLNLADAIVRMRTRHPRAVPVVELQAAAMKTKFGGKSKPVFGIVEWKNLDRGEARDEPALPAAKQKPTIVQQDMDDEIPY